MTRLEVSGAVRPIYGSLGVKRFKIRELYSCIADCRTEIPVIFSGPFSTFRGYSKRKFIYSTITRRTPEYVLWNCGVPRNPGWKNTGL